MLKKKVRLKAINESSKSQDPGKIQIPSLNWLRGMFCLRFGNWTFIGIWGLGFGAYVAAMQLRPDGRAPDQIRTIGFELDIAPHATGSVLVAMGNTRVICGVTIEEIVPRWMKDQGVTGGWLTAEYSMLPYSTTTRKPRDIAKGRLDGRSSEIQRLIGRSLRSVIDLEKLGPRTIWIDCDVLQADGGTRTAAITGASLAVTVACKKLLEEKKIASSPMHRLTAAVSAGIVEGNAMVDLNYEEDKAAAVDFNLVATEDGEFVEIQGSGEEATFTQGQLEEMLALGRNAIAQLIVAQRNVLGHLEWSEAESKDPVALPLSSGRPDSATSLGLTER